MGEGAFREQTLIDQALFLHGEAMVGTNINCIAGVVDNEHGQDLHEEPLARWGEATPHNTG